MRMLVPALLMLGCTPETTPPEQVDPIDGIPAVACGDAESTHRFKTSDGVRLEADYWPATEPGSPVVVLLHMTPEGGFHRGDYPTRVRSALHDVGMSVLTLDRRGSGESKGTARDAYSGEGGRLDVEAAVRQALSAGCVVDPERVFLVGASNGTTSVFDYVVAHDPELPDAAAVVFLSPGEYTESQFSFADAGPQSIPWLWMYPTNEPWSLGFVDDAPADWEFVERGTQHGTLMFDGGELEDATVADMTRVLGAASP